MDPNVAVELATARHAELRRTAEHRRIARLESVPRRAPQRVLRTLSRSAFETTQRLRHRAAQAIAPATPRQSTLEPCC